MTESTDRTAAMIAEIRSANLDQLSTIAWREFHRAERAEANLRRMRDWLAKTQDAVKNLSISALEADAGCTRAEAELITGTVAALAAEGFTAEDIDRFIEDGALQ